MPEESLPASLPTHSSEASLVSLLGPTSFSDASDAVIRFLKREVPLGYWSVSRFDGENQIYLTVADDDYGLIAGDSTPWSESLCQHMVAGAPRVAPDAMAVPEYAGAAVASRLPIGTYVGIPIRRADGELFGTLCGIDPVVRSPEFSRHRPLLELLTRLLSTVLDAELRATEALRSTERALLLAETDPMTGLYNRRGWERFVRIEEDRFRRYGDPCSVIILDLDGLKTINDTVGHDAGDEYIRLAASTLRRTARSTDVVARLGGDEFGVIAVQTTMRDSEGLVRRLSAALTEAGVSGSLGHARHNMQRGLTGTWHAADQAMYLEKERRQGRHLSIVPPD